MAREEINGRREEQLSSSSVTEFSLAWKVKEQREVSATAARWSLQACFSGAEEGRREPRCLRARMEQMSWMREAKEEAGSWRPRNRRNGHLP